MVNTIKILEKFGDIGSYAIPAIVGANALFRGNAMEALMMGGMGYLKGRCMFAIKRAFPRARPEPYVMGKVSKENNESFPSSHTGGAFLGVGMAWGLYGANSPVTMTTTALASLVGLSRYLSKKHWLTDVFSGAAMGMANGYLSVRCSAIFKDLLQPH